MMLEGGVIVGVKSLGTWEGKKKQVPGGGTGLHRHRETSFIVTPMLLCL